MIVLDDFLTKYRVDRAAFDASKLTWSEMESLHADYVERIGVLTPAANYFRDVLQQLPAVHSLKIRIKDPEHLVEKVVRKRIADPTREIGLANYRKEITDLIGVRVLHLFKDEWLAIHAAISKLWMRHEKPVANIRKGDPTELFREAGCRIKEHPAGYRSVHYVVKYQPANELQLVEIQVRTIFEEGWSEIDHRIRYPYNTGDPILSQFLAIFNGLAGNADHMGLYIKFLAAEMDRIRESHSAEQTRLRSELDALRLELQKSKISAPEKKRITGMLNTLDSSSRISSATFADSIAQAAARAFAPAPSSALATAVEEAMKKYSSSELLQEAFKNVSAQMESSNAFERLINQRVDLNQSHLNQLFERNRAKKK